MNVRVTDIGSQAYAAVGLLKEGYPDTRAEWLEALYLGLIGVPLAFFSIYGAYPWRFEPLVWLAVAGLYVVLMLRRSTRHPVRLGFWGAFAAVILSTATQAAFLSTYAVHNPSLDLSDIGTIGTSSAAMLWMAKSPVLALLFVTVVAIGTRFAVRARGRRYYEAQTRAHRRSKKNG